MRVRIIHGLLALLFGLLPAAVIGQSQAYLEYWFDDNFDQRESIAISTSEQDQSLTLDLHNNNNYPMGYHQLNTRVVIPGVGVSAISASSVLKVLAGNASALEYWVDDDFENKHLINAEIATDGDTCCFIGKLDLNDVPPGYHRLYYRVKSPSGRSASAVSMTPIIVKSQYQQDPENLTVTNYSITVDNQTPTNYKVQYPKYEITQPYVLDARNLSAGNHTVKAKFWNSQNAGVSTESTFKVVIPEEPSVTLTAQQQDGLVKLQFNSVPNDIMYGIRCTDANGVSRKAYNGNGGIYPETYSYTDNPPAGTYNYYVKMQYRDWTGAEKMIQSNIVTVTVANAQSEKEAAEQYGNITGKIVCDKNMPAGNPYVLFSDGVAVPVQGMLFGRRHLPEGTSLMMTVVGDNTHIYNSDPVVVKAGSNPVTISGTLREEFQPDNLVHDLEITSVTTSSETDGLHLRMNLRNRSQNLAWNGFIHIKAIDKKKAEPDEIIDMIYFSNHNMLMATTNNYTFGGGETKTVEIVIKELTVKKSTPYYVFFESEGKYVDTYPENQTKPIAGNFSMGSNPLVVSINPVSQPTQQYAKWNSDAKEEFAYLMLGAGSVTPGFEGVLGDMEQFAHKVIEATGKSNAKSAADAISGWINGKNPLEAINDENLNQVAEAAREVFKNLHDKVKKRIVEKFWSMLVGELSDDVKAMPLINFVADVYKIQDTQPFDQSMNCMSLLYGALAIGGEPVPIASMMKAYLVVGKTLIEEAKEIIQIENGNFIANRLVKNRINTNGNEDRVNTAVDFKLKVKDNKKKGKLIDFTDRKVQEQIKKIYINVEKIKNGEPVVFSFDTKFYKDCLMLQTHDNSNKEQAIQSYFAIYALFMEIHWNNGRITYIPLIREDDKNGVEICFDGVNIYEDNDFSETQPVVYTVTLTTTTGKDNMADDIYLGTNSKRE